MAALRFSLPQALARRRARGSAGLPALAVLLAGTGLAALLADTFALPVSSGRQSPPPSRKPQQGGPMPRANLKDRVEIKDEEPPAEKPAPPPMPGRRVPYTISLFAHTSEGHSGLAAPKRDLIIDRVTAALENTQDWVKSVDVRVTIDNHAHKMSKSIPSIEGDEVVMKETKRQLAPWNIEVTVHLEDGGKPVVMSSSKHAQATITEAVDDMYDFLRRQMRKEKERRLQKIRKTKDEQMNSQESLFSDDEVAAMEAQAEQDAKDAELEEMYSRIEAKTSE